MIEQKIAEVTEGGLKIKNAKSAGAGDAGEFDLVADAEGRGRRR
jgi:hypothetical protein